MLTACSVLFEAFYIIVLDKAQEVENNGIKCIVAYCLKASVYLLVSVVIILEENIVSE